MATAEKATINVSGMTCAACSARVQRVLEKTPGVANAAVDLMTATASVAYAGHTVEWWAPLLVLGVVTAAVPYTSGIAGIRRLGSRLASFVALLEVVASVLFAWLLLDQLPLPVQLLGGVLILGGVVCVKLGERATAGPVV